MNVLLLENIDKSVVKCFGDNYNVECISDALNGDALIEKIQNVHIIGIRSKTNLTKKILEQAPNLLLVGCFCIGTNQVDIDYCIERNIALFNSPFMSTRSVSELIIGLIISLARKLGDKNQMMHGGLWNKSSKNNHEIRGKTLGIIGYGHVGSQVSVLAENMGMNVIFYDIAPVMSLGNSTKMVSMEALLRSADYVSLHVPLLPETNNLIGDTELQQMKSGSYLLNLSRGNVVNITALKKYLDNGHLMGAALDVFPDEPENKKSQWQFCLQYADNVILTPHIGGSTEEAQYEIGQDVANKILSYFETGSTANCLTLPNIQIGKCQAATRIINIHKNIPGALAQIMAVMDAYNIIRQYLATKDAIGYCIIDVEVTDSKSILEALNKLSVNIWSRTQ